MSNLRNASRPASPASDASADENPPLSHDHLYQQWRDTRRFTETLCQPLATEDYVIQSMPDVSPTRWHLAHTTWFFDRFILAEHIANYQPVNPQYFYLFNSYYNAAGPQFSRPQRGLLSRPTVREVYEYRRLVDERLTDLLEHATEEQRQVLDPLVTIGIHHEQQHQELLLTDIKHVFSVNPLLPAYQQRPVVAHHPVVPTDWTAYEEGIYEIGFAGPGFCFDNETPRHKVFLRSFELASRLTTNGEYLQFIEDGGYRHPQWWLSLGWDTVRNEQWEKPFYWYRDGSSWMQFTLAGPMPLDHDEPACHLSYFEADAFARWAEARLPTEQEWEIAAAEAPVTGSFVQSTLYHPAVLDHRAQLAHPAQMFGELWQWTASPYSPYPGFKPAVGALGEYNGKFMCNQYVLRGGSCATARQHIRRTYRNFFPPDARWQFTGLRLAKDV
jgi:ergothioneine biosynthesis protein EgtB